MKTANSRKSAHTEKLEELRAARAKGEQSSTFPSFPCRRCGTLRRTERCTVCGAIH